jgi:integrase
MAKLTWKDLRKPRIGDNGKPVPIPDPQIDNLRYNWQGNAHYAQYRYKSPITGKWRPKGLGRVPTPDEAQDILLAEWQDARLHDPEAQPSSSYDDALELTIREKARALRRQVMRGVEPRVGEHGLTLRDALQAHYAFMRRDGRSEGSIVDYTEFAGFLWDWLDVPLRHIDPTMMVKRHRQIAEKAGSYKKLKLPDLTTEDTKPQRGRGGPTAANKVIVVLRAAWGTAKGEDQSLPAWPKEVFKRRWHRPTRRKGIKTADFPTWLRQVRAMQNTMRRDYYLLAVLTGLRRETLSSIRVEHIDFERRTLHIPKPKGGPERAYTIPLSAAAVAVIERRIVENEVEAKRAGKKPSPWLFPANSKSGHIKEPRAVPEDGITAAFTIHGLRHTYSNVASAAGVGDDHRRLLMNQALDHSDAHTHYLDPDEFEALREDQEKVAAKLAAYGLTVAEERAKAA